VPAGLLLLGLVPLVFGALRLVQLAGGPEITPANPRFAASPLPLVLHIVGASVFAVLGAFQFWAGLRRRRPGWHRLVGRLLVPCGLLVGLSGLWMTVFYARQEGTGELLYALRLLFGSAMVASIVLGVAAILRRDVSGHRAWMARGYAIGLGAGTQVLTLGAGALIVGPPGMLGADLLMGAGWVINLAVAERAIRRRPAPPVRTAAVQDARKVPRLPARWLIRLAWGVHRAIYRFTGGRRGLRVPTPGRFGMLRLTTVGRRSGKERAVILGYYEDGPGLVTLAMNGWGAGEPAWWLNLRAWPDARVELKDGTRLVRARAAEEAARARLWEGFRAYSDAGVDLDAYARMRSTETAVVVLEPRG
jgi:deazaflavin-dependent oxidoreductase (nitroreductase family)